MKISLETMWNLIMMTMACLLIAGLIGSFIYILQARSSLEGYAARIECSKDRESELEKCQREAETKGLRLEADFLTYGEGRPCFRLILHYQVSGTLFSESRDFLKGEAQTYVR